VDHAAVGLVYGSVDLFHDISYRKIFSILKIAGASDFYKKTPLNFSKIMF
jgi:hypothetical protein